MLVTTGIRSGMWAFEAIGKACGGRTAKCKSGETVDAVRGRPHTPVTSRRDARERGGASTVNPVEPPEDKDRTLDVHTD